MSTFNELEQQSLQEYNTFLELTLALEGALEPIDTEKVRQLTRELQQIEETVKATDKKLNHYFQDGHHVPEESLSKKRIELMQAIVAKNTELGPKVRAMMAMHSSELATIRHGRNTLGGYANPSSKAGRIINTAN